MEIFATFFGGLAIAAVVGITTLAIKKPKQYTRLGIVLLVLTTLIFMFVIAYTRGGDAMQRALIDYLDPDKRTQAYAAARAVQVDPSALAWVFIATNLYVLALFYLPMILGESGDKDADDD